YLLVGADKATVDVAFNYGGPQNRTFTNVPVQRNYRTNIYGSLLTNTTDFNVVIEPTFATTNYNLGALYTASQIGGAVTLSDNVDFDRTIAVQPGKTMSVNLNGKTVKNTTDLWENPSVPNSWSLFSVRGTDSKLTLSGDGDVIAKANDCYAVDVQDGGHLVIEDGHFNGNVHAVYVYEGVAEIKGGTFEVQQKYSDADKADEFVLNCYDANRENGTAKIIVTGGTFIGFNPGDCKAEGNGTNFVAPGYASIPNGTAADGRTIWKVVPAVEATTEAELENGNASFAINTSFTIGCAYLSNSRTKNISFTNSSVINADNSIIQTFLIGKNSNVTISGRGKIVGPTRASSNTATIWLANGGTVNINGNMTIEAGSGSSTNNCIRIVKGTANIYDGYFHAGLDKNGGANACILLTPGTSSSTSPANLNIYGGVFETDGDFPVINIQDGASANKYNHVLIYGGTFVGFDPSIGDSGANVPTFVAPGYKSVETTYNGKQAWKVVKE
ncbi:MAG: hypothetical protein UDG88_09765, partial [Muribaculaceae bacterium]|nr:hypothetical protein [Muribaculaceae bacterium]